MGMKTFARFALHLLKGRWMVVVVSFYVLSFAGATYIFSIYSGSIKEALQYDQQTIDTLGFFKDLGANVGIISGLLNEILPPWVILSVGAGMNLFGYLMIWLAVTKRIARPPVGQMYLYMSVGANSQTFANTGVLVTCVKNFPHSRGVVLGLLKGFVGLSGAIFEQVYRAIYGNNASGVILLVGWLPSLVSLLFMFFVRAMPPQIGKNDGKHFLSFLYLALLLAGFLMMMIVVENQVALSSATFKVMGAITFLLVASSLFIAARAELETFHPDRSDHGKKQQKEKEKKHEEDQHGVQEMESSDQRLDAPRDVKAPMVEAQSCKPLQTKTAASLNLQAPTETISSKAPAESIVSSFKLATKSFFSNWPARGDDFTIPQAILSLDMWILFVATTCGIGATLTAIDNMGQIGTALGYSQISINTFVALISIWNFLGRVIAGFSSELLLQRYKFPRTLMLTIVLALACVGHLLIAFPTTGSLYISSILIGLCFGAQWPVLFAVISELFGLKYYATLYNLGAVSSPLGSYLLNVRVAGHLYDIEARKEQAQLLSKTTSALHAATRAPAPASSDLSCVGPQCFRTTFLIMTAVSFFGSLVSVILVLRTRKFYSQDIYARFHKSDEKEEAPNVTEPSLVQA